MKTSANSPIPPVPVDIPVETHPFEPFIPQDARLLIMGTFPPAQSRWAMPFYYPNRLNDFWRIMGLVFFGNASRFYDELSRSFRLDDIKTFLSERGIALSDTGYRVRRLRANASDAFLEIVEANDLRRLLPLMPHCHSVATTGALAAKVISGLTGTAIPGMGQMVTASALSGADGIPLSIWRMPSTSRAYPLPLAKKAEAYASMFKTIGLL
ncbi:MAG: uracil-DNA glycosylase family protein [Pseudoflavonifractor sp.]|nr:uracil-DNA glycosylase family protein [Alloprevotella sp.]MCM1116712.1 uracil-DNA glycosylase family protein [Pseudoflavonifractor sp.]